MALQQYTHMENFEMTRLDYPTFGALLVHHSLGIAVTVVAGDGIGSLVTEGK